MPSLSMNIGLMRNRLWLSAAGGIVPFDFDASLTTFTPAMAKRTAPGPFAAAPIVQGKLDGSGTPDQIVFSRGSQISDYFYQTFDPRQATIVFWITPEWNGNDGLNHYLFGSQFIDQWTVWKSSSNNLVLTAQGTSISVSVSSWVAGTTYCVVARWDRKNPLDGTNYLSLSINDVHTFGSATAPSDYQPATEAAIGGAPTTLPANAIIEGLTIYRRPLFDGTYGIDVGNGDEIAQIYNAGAGKDPTEITGSWDVVFCLPTNSTAGSLVTGTGEAWTHPHSSNVLTDWHAMTTYASSGWSTKGTPSVGPADAATADKIFAGGYKWTCDADAEGISQSKTSLTADQNHVLRCLAHSSTADAIRIRVTDDTNAADILTYTFGGGSDRDTPGVAIITWELPTTARNGVGANCTAMTIAIEGTATGQVVVLHQCEVLANLVDNPSMETGGGDPWIPSGWSGGGVDAGEGIRELGEVHSGGSSLRLTTDATNEGFSQNFLGAAAVGGWYAMGLWGRRVTGTPALAPVSDSVARNNGTQSWPEVGIAPPTGAALAHRSYVFRKLSAGSVAFANWYGAGDSIIDDVYAYALLDVGLTVTPANLANSAESSGLRVDGRDTLVQPITTLTATRGCVRFRYTPRHSAADAVKFGTTGSAALLLTAFGDADNYSQLYWSAANTLLLNVKSAGVLTSSTWDATGAIVAGTTYGLEVEYSATQCTLKVNGTTRITVTPGAGINFGTIPGTIYWGTGNTGSSQADATFAAPS